MIIISIVLGIIIGTSFVFDLFYGKIPNKIIVVGFLLWFPCVYLDGGFYRVITSFGSMLLIGSFLFLIYLFRGIGAGDVKLMALIVSFLSFNDGVKLIILIFFVGAFFGVIKVLMLLVYRVLDKETVFDGKSIKFTGPILTGYLLMLLSNVGF